MIESQDSNPELEFAEVVSGQTRSLVVETYTATGVADGPTVEWSLAGADMGAFTIDGGVLTFAREPNYEAPTDAGHATDEDGNNTYHVMVQAMAGDQTASLEVEVEVTNADDPGVVVMSPLPPRVGTTLTATLTDEDGVLEVAWGWGRYEPRRSGKPTAEQVQSASTQRLMTSADEGRRIGVAAYYTDGHGPNKLATNPHTSPVLPLFQIAGTQDTTFVEVVSSDLATRSLVVEEYTARGAEAAGVSVVWSLSGEVRMWMRLSALGSSDGVLRFASAPNYEVPTDSDGDHVYGEGKRRDLQTGVRLRGRSG